MDDALQDALDAAEEAVAAEVADVLAEVADEFAASLDAATEIVAARFSVAGIARMWGQRVPRLVRRLLGVAETAAHQAATDVDATLPDGWDDLPGRYDEDRELPPTLGDYVTTTEHLLRAVGDRLAAVAVDELAAGVNAGETIDQLRTRLRTAFAREGAQLGPGREERIARTEAARAWNSATLAAAQALTGPDRPLVKQWLSRRDADVRDSHAEVNGQLRLLDEPFTVAGVPMSAPGDPTAPPDLVCNCRCALALARADQVAASESQTPAENQLTNPRKEPSVPDHVTAASDGMPTRAWSTPDDTALAFENEETGDGRIFAAGSLYWDTGPWPLQYADEMLMGHEGAELAASIETLGRNGDRITGSGVLYTSRPAGADAAQLLDEGAPLGVSVDLDDLDVEFVDRSIITDDDRGEVALAASLATASVMRLDDGAWAITASTGAEWTASGATLSRAQHSVQLITGPDGAVSAAALRQAFTATGVLKAAAGDPDDPENGVVIHSERTGDFLIRITRARLRGATLVAMPAYNRARIVLDPAEEQASARPAPSSSADLAQLLAAAPGDVHWKVVAYVSASPIAVGPRQVATALSITMESARGHLSRAAAAGRLVRLARGLYVGASTIPEGADATAAAVPTDSEDPALQDLVASAWTAMQDTDPMPAAWFREPTAEELPPGSGGVHYSGGRVYGWVAQAGEPHAGMPGRNLTIDSLGDIDTTHFLRAKFKLDDGSLIRAGAMTMNVGHHRDGAECETASCQFDDTRTVAGIVTVGMGSGGMWFSGAAAPGCPSGTGPYSRPASPATT